MPVYRRPTPGDDVPIGAIRNDLIEELRNPKPLGQPIILEDATPQTNSVRVHVVWDRWTECPRELRHQVIEDAYMEALGSKQQLPITLALGLTVPEAIGVGLLPYQIAPAPRRTNDISDERYLEAMLKAGASTLLGRQNPQLRFATPEDAETAMESLQSELPGSKWLIIREVPDASTSTSSITTMSLSILPDE